jgi:hypothetical protein
MTWMRCMTGCLGDHYTGDPGLDGFRSVGRTENARQGADRRQRGAAARETLDGPA